MDREEARKERRRSRPGAPPALPPAPPSVSTSTKGPSDAAVQEPWEEQADRSHGTLAAMIHSLIPSRCKYLLRTYSTAAFAPSTGTPTIRHWSQGACILWVGISWARRMGERQTGNDTGLSRAGSFEE